VGARAAVTPAEQEALVRELEESGSSVPKFAAAHGLHASTLYTWRRRVRAGEPVRRSRWKKGGRGNFSAEERRAALEAWAKSGLTAVAFAKLWGVSSESLRGCRARYELGGPKALEPKKLGRPKGEGRRVVQGPRSGAAPRPGDRRRDRQRIAHGDIDRATGAPRAHANGPLWIVL